MPRLLGVGAVWVERSQGRAHAAGPLVEALCAARRAGWTAGVLTVRGGDRAGTALARSLAGRGLEDLSNVFLDRATPVMGPEGGAAAEAFDLCGVVMPKLLRRRAFRDAAAGADVVLVDAGLPEAALRRVLEAARGPVFALESAAGGAQHIVPFLPLLRVAVLGEATLRRVLGLRPGATIGAIAAALARAEAGAIVIALGDTVSLRFEGGSATLVGGAPRPARAAGAAAVAAELARLR